MLEVAVQKRVANFTIATEFSVEQGITCLFGRSGAGKTTIMKMIAGLVRPDSGRISLSGTDVFDSQNDLNKPPHARQLGYIFQEPRLFPHLTIKQNLLFGRWLRRPKDDINFDETVDLLGVAHLLSRRPVNLSGGEQQRVAIGRALLAGPKLLLMDEPLASLDNPRKQEILPYIERLQNQLDIPILYVTHALEEAARIASNIILLEEGRIAASGPMEQTLTRLDLRPLTGRFQAGTVIDANVARHLDSDALTELSFNGGALTVPIMPSPIGAAVRLRVFARDVIIALEPPRMISVRNCLKGTISAISVEEGAFAELRINVGNVPFLARITRSAAKELSLAPGKSVYLLIKSIAIDRQLI